MKHLVAIFFFSCFAFNIIAQGCLPGGIRFDSQSDIDSFPINYPGCTVIEGNVCIGDCQSSSSDINNLDSLSQLTSIQGELSITGNDFLINLAGLDHLSEIEGDVAISLNANLKSMQGLDQIRVMKGSFYILSNPAMDSIKGFEMLDSIDGSLFISGMTGLTSISAFPNIRYLGGYYLSDNSYLTAINDLTNLEYLGDFFVSRNDELALLPAFPLLSEIDGNFRLIDNQNLYRIVGYENIRRITGSVEISVRGPELNRIASSRQINGFHNLTFVGGDLRVHYVYELDTLDAFILVDSIGQTLDIALLSTTNNFPQPNHFKYIGRSILLEGIDNLENLQCFSELDSIYGELYLRFCPNIVNLSGIDQLRGIGGDLSISLTGLPDLKELANIKSVGGDLNISDCDLLTDFSGLEGITSIDGGLWIFGNNNLESLEGIHNIDPQTFKPTGNAAINLINNSKLSYCDLDNICLALRDLRKSYRIYGNSEGCLDISHIECEDYGLSGTVFYDLNQNKVLDANEVGLPGFNIRVEPENEIVNTNSEGRFLFIADEGSEHTLRLEHGSNWFLTTDSIQYTRSYYSGLPVNSENIFGIYPAYVWHDLPVSLTSEPARCNMNVRFYVHYLNAGTVPEDGRIILQYDQRALFLSAIAVAPDSHDLVNHKLIWDIDSLPAFHDENPLLLFKMPNEMSAGEYLEFTIRSFIDSSGVEIEKDLFTYSALVRCGFDPNDKIVMPPGIRDEKYTLKNDPLSYTIRFENLGNAEAIDITIQDTLDASFDMSTFYVINSSYPVFTKLNGHHVEFFFKNIWLGKNKRGFVTYEIKPFDDVEDFTAVRNRARIYFDLNQPVTTNATFNTLVAQICEDVSASLDTTICRGESFLGYTEPGVYLDTVHIGSICDSFSTIRLMVLESEVIHLDTAICEGESFFGVDSTGLYTFEFVNQVTGCTDIVELNLEVIPLGQGVCGTGIFDPSEHKLKVYPNPVRSRIFVEATGPIESISIWSSEGILMKQETEIVDQNAEIYLNDQLPVGLYILGVRIDGRIHFAKVISIQ